MKPNSSLILWQYGVFSFTKVCIFYQCCLSWFSSQQYMFLWFCKTVLVKKYTPCQGMIWFSLTKVVSFTLAFMWELNYTIKAWLSLRKTWKNGSRALPSNSRRGLRAPDPANPSSEKMTSQPTFFLLHVLPQSVRKLHRLFNISTINTHFDMFLKIKACMGVIYFLVRVRKHESNLPSNMHTTVGKKTQWYVVKCEILSEATLLPYLWQRGVFLFPKA